MPFLWSPKVSTSTSRACRGIKRKSSRRCANWSTPPPPRLRKPSSGLSRCRRERPLCLYQGVKTKVNFGFWRGVDTANPQGLLLGGGTKMKHVELAIAKDIRKKAFADMVKAAVQLNRTRGDPTKPSTK